MNRSGKTAQAQEYRRSATYRRARARELQGKAWGAAGALVLFLAVVAAGVRLGIF